ncbi:MAG: HNH endonuclease [Nitrococcus sp.]|nr:HNH endonuclease [Nitrococcus sp.]
MRKKPWTREELRALRLRYPDTDTPTLARALGRSAHALHHMAVKQGIVKSAAYKKAQGAQKAATHNAAALRTRFKPGLTPWNKGMVGFYSGGRSAQAWFKDGHRPMQWRPLGSFRVDSNGVLQKKVCDYSGPGRTRNWVSVHALIWARAFGPIPEGHILVFCDGNRGNIRLDNLMLIARAEHVRRNSLLGYPPQLREVILVNERLKRAIKERA